MFNSLTTRIALLMKLYFVHLQELLYLYGFVVDNNPDDYLMVTLIMMYVLKDNNLEFCHLSFVAKK